MVQGKLAPFLPGESEAEEPASRDSQQALDRQRKQRVRRKPLKPKPGTMFRAKTHMPMTEREVQRIFEDPKSVPDSDDEEDLDEWKVLCFS